MAFRILKNNVGQGQAVEYAVVFFLVVAVVAGMSTYVKRAVQARIRGARNYMFVQVNGVYNQYYVNGLLRAEYEPYYAQSTTFKDDHTTQNEQQMPLLGGEGTYISGISSVVDSTGTSQTASPSHAH